MSLSKCPTPIKMSIIKLPFLIFKNILKKQAKTNPLKFFYHRLICQNHCFPIKLTSKKYPIKTKTFNLISFQIKKSSRSYKIQIKRKSTIFNLNKYSTRNFLRTKKITLFLITKFLFINNCIIQSKILKNL